MSLSRISVSFSFVLPLQHSKKYRNVINVFSPSLNDRYTSCFLLFPSRDIIYLSLSSACLSMLKPEMPRNLSREFIASIVASTLDVLFLSSLISFVLISSFLFISCMKDAAFSYFSWKFLSQSDSISNSALHKSLIAAHIFSRISISLLLNLFTLSLNSLILLLYCSISSNSFSSIDFSNSSTMLIDGFSILLSNSLMFFSAIVSNALTYERLLSFSSWFITSHDKMLLFISSWWFLMALS